MRIKETHPAGGNDNAQDIYDFSGPLWEKYFAETRKKVKFPRGYKEVSSIQ